MKPFYALRIAIIIAVILGVNASLTAQTTTFSTAGGPYSYLATGTQIVVTLIGGKGGDNNQYPSGGSWPAHGGYGGKVVCTLQTTPGVTYYVYVGGKAPRVPPVAPAVAA